MLLSLNNKNMLTPRQKSKIIKETGVHAKDTGSPEVQIALLSRQIEELTGHLKKHKKDKSLPPRPSGHGRQPSDAPSLLEEELSEGVIQRY